MKGKHFMSDRIMIRRDGICYRNRGQCEEIWRRQCYGNCKRCYRNPQTAKRDGAGENGSSGSGAEKNNPCGHQGTGDENAILLAENSMTM